MLKLGVFDTDFLVEGPIYTWSDAEDALDDAREEKKAKCGYTHGLYIAELCPEHEEHALDDCPECAAL